MKKLFSTLLILPFFLGCATGPIAEPEIHLIPEGFTGEVVLHHQYPHATPLLYADDSRLYNVSTDGTVYTSSEPNYGVRNPEVMNFYYVLPDEPEIRTLIAPCTHDFADSETICIIGGYQVGNNFHYAVDTVKNADNYPNPAIDGSR